MKILLSELTPEGRVEAIESLPYESVLAMLRQYEQASGVPIF